MDKRVVCAAATGLLLSFLVQQPAIAQPAKPDGEMVFRQRCQSCHAIAAGKATPLGPNLYGVVGRKAASSPVAFRYSEALKNSPMTWTPPNLDKFLAMPAKTIPGTKMPIGLSDAAQREAVIAYLARVK